MPKILVADDDDRMVRLLTMTLPDQYQILEAKDGEEAVSAVQQHAPELVLLDVNMPGLNGFEVLRKLRQSDEMKHTRVIMVTARSDEADQYLGAALGADAYLTKPFSPIALLGKVNQLLEGS